MKLTKQNLEKLKNSTECCLFIAKVEGGNRQVDITQIRSLWKIFNEMQAKSENVKNITRKYQARLK